jgi:hypothetical protein
VSPAIRKSYKKECQEKSLPRRLDTAHSCLGIQPLLFERAIFLRPSNLVSSPRAKRRYVSSPLWFHFAVVEVPFRCRDGRPSFSETTSLTVVHCMSGNAWSYWRLAAYGFIRLSEEA